MEIPANCKPESHAKEALLMEEFLQHERASRDTLDVKKVYIDMADGDLVAGIMLSQIIYWNLPAHKGCHKLRVKHDGYLGLAKTREDWYEECRISVKQVDRALDILRDGGLVETKIFGFRGKRMLHIRILWENFVATYNTTVMANWKKAHGVTDTDDDNDTNPEPEEANCPNGNMQTAERVTSNTETTTETNKEGAQHSQAIPENQSPFR